MRHVKTHFVGRRITCAPQVILTRRHLAIVMSYAAGGDLHEYVRRFQLNEDVARCGRVCGLA
jgi:hypothetical protein